MAATQKSPFTQILLTTSQLKLGLSRGEDKPRQDVVEGLHSAFKKHCELMDFGSLKELSHTDQFCPPQVEILHFPQPICASTLKIKKYCVHACISLVAQKRENVWISQKKKKRSRFAVTPGRSKGNTITSGDIRLIWVILKKNALQDYVFSFPSRPPRY